MAESIEAFEDNFADAKYLIAYARAFSNNRARRMRRELRERVGDEIRIPTRERDDLDCLESDDLFVILKPNGAIDRTAFLDRRPLLRQAIVAAAASLETYLADKVMKYIGEALRLEEVPPKLRKITLTVGHWADIERAYQRRSWGIRGIIEEAVRERASTAPNQIGESLGIIGIEGWARKIDGIRQSRRGQTVEELDELTARRNKIAHTADGAGQGRSALEIDEAEEHLEVVRSVVDAIETLVNREWY